MLKVQNRSRAVLSICVAALIAHGSSARAALITPIILSSQTAPGTNLPLYGFDSPQFSAAGHLLFDGISSPPYNYVLMTVAPGASSPSVAMYETQAVPASPGLTYSDINYFTVDSTGALAVFGQVAGSGITSSNNFSYFYGPPGATALVARDGDQVPGLSPGVAYKYLDQIGARFGTPGQSGFLTALTGGDVTTANNSCLMLDTGGTVSVAIRRGDPAPRPGLTIGDFFDFRMNSSGLIAIDSLMSGNAVLVGTPGAWNIVAINGDSFPGVAGATFTRAYFPRISNKGDLAFDGSLKGTGINSSNSGALFAGTASSFSILARDLDPAPGTDALYKSISGSPVIAVSDSGRVLFKASLQGSNVTTANDSAIFLGKPGAVSLLVREGSQAPGLAAGIVFADRGISGWTLQANDLICGQGTLSGSGVTTSNNRALFATDPLGNLKCILRTGDAVSVAAGDTRTISSIVTEANNGLNILINQRNQIAMTLHFIDGSEGVFLERIPYSAIINLTQPADGRPAFTAPHGAKATTGAGLLTQTVTGSRGYLPVPNPGTSPQILLDLANDTPALVAAVSQLLTDQGYSVSSTSSLLNTYHSIADYDLLVTYPSTQGQLWFAWDLSEITGTQLANVAIVPEPGSIFMFSSLALGAYFTNRARMKEGKRDQRSIHH